LRETRLTKVAEGVAAAFGARALVSYQRGYPVTFNHAKQASLARSVADCVKLEGQAVDGNVTPVMIAEDFSFMLETRPGAYIFMGNGGSTPLHTSTYDFNDEALPVGIAYWTSLAETALNEKPILKTGFSRNRKR
jgi:metal-dependent amidase/aminoacylase/carboxypeptidase family protein